MKPTKRTINRRRKFASPVGEGMLGMTNGVLLPEKTDTRKMTATFVVVTRSIDRDDEVVEPRGCLPHMDAYRANPVVLFNHEDDGYPIALSEDEDRRLSWNVTDEQIISTAHFHGKTQQSEEVASLVLCNPPVLRAASICFDPIKTGRLPASVGSGKHYQEWEPSEWSIMALGANAEALRMSLDKKVVKSLSLRRALEPFAAKARSKRSWSNGVSKAMADETPDEKRKREEAEAAAKAADDEPADEPADEKPADEKPAEEAKAEDIKPDDDPDATEEDEETPEEAEDDVTPDDEDTADPVADAPPGAHTLASMATHYKGCLEYVAAAMSRNENPAVKKMLEKEAEFCQQRLDMMHEMAGTHYPEHDFEAIKSFYAPEAQQSGSGELPEDKDKLTKGKRPAVTKSKPADELAPDQEKKMLLSIRKMAKGLAA